MTFMVSPWWVWAVLSLALFGAWLVVRQVAIGLQRTWTWLHARWYRKRRGQPAGVSDDCWFDAHEDCDGCECECCDCSEPLTADLPPEQTWEELTREAGVPVDSIPAGHRGFGGLGGPFTATVDPAWSKPTREWQGDALDRTLPAGIEYRRERAPWWEAEQRQAYEAMGFEFPSGLMARVRELTP